MFLPNETTEKFSRMMKFNMKSASRLFLTAFLSSCLICFLGKMAFSQEVPQGTLEQSLKLMPTQKGIDIDIPSEEESGRCKIDYYEGRKGYIVTGPQNNTLRLFLDNKGEGRINQWAYFKNGVEVYRDIDSDGNGSADQFRWLNTAGTRWGVDTDGDYIVDYWKTISPEEVSQEIVQALATNDVKRFMRVALNQDELKALSLGEELNAVVAKKIAALEAGFADAAKAVALGKDVHWYQLNAVLPGLVPSGNRGNQKDLIVYENAWTTVGDKETKQVALGTLVKVGDNNWRTIDLPKVYDENQILHTFIPVGGPQVAGQADSEVVGLINQYQGLVAKLPETAAADKSGLYKEIVFTMLKIVSKSPTQGDRELWVRLMVDTILEAVQENAFPDGPGQIQEIYETFKKLGNDELAAYIRYRQITVDFYTAMNEGKDEVKTYMKWLEDLEGLVGEYPKTETAVEAMMQIAINKEMTARSPEEPLKWYNKIATEAAGKPIGEKAKGAVRRLNATGQVVPFKGTDTAGKAFDIASLKGNPVLLCFWDARCVDELISIKQVADSAKLRVVGVNLNADAKAFQEAVAKLGWMQLFAPGGLDSPLAVYWGVQSTPHLVLYSADGKVVNPNVLNADDLKQIMSEAE